MDGAVDTRIVDIKMRHQAHLRQVTDGGADAVHIKMRGEGLQTIRGHFDEDHVAVADIDADRSRIAQPFGESGGARVVFGQPRNMMIKCI